jgi:hypothetical protein
MVKPLEDGKGLAQCASTSDFERDARSRAVRLRRLVSIEDERL